MDEFHQSFVWGRSASG
ncbi:MULTISPECIES: VanZ family protein [unclassified Gluconobacter]